MLAHYYDGTSTQEEEKYLRIYFKNTDRVAPELRTEGEIFRSLSDIPTPQLPDGLESRLSDAIDSWAEAEAKAEVNRKRLRPIKLRAAIGIAAALAVVLALGIFLPFRENTTPLHADTCATPEEAYAQTEKALQIFAGAINKSLAGMETVTETSERIQEQVHGQLQQLNNI